MPVIKATPETKVLFEELTELIRRHQHISAYELLAVAANMVGKLIALQDQRVVSPELAIETVMRNIEMGNKEALSMLEKPQGNA
jgi:hypothetical protein